MVERFKNGKMHDRNHMDLKQFNNKFIFTTNIEKFYNNGYTDKN